MKLRIGYIAWICFVISSCSETTLVKPKSGPPAIRFVSIEPKVVTEFKDSIIINIHYEDSDGDLGTDDPDLEQLTVQDLRLQTADGYHVGLLAPPDTKLSIEGDLKIYLKNTFLLGTADEESTAFEITLTDRAGNKSNPAVTDQIKIIRE
ncbi:MAG: hypothetical protein GC181_11915 [Bacteroidetes bacterium]|nr:hypothetical protein [Bacteroidota bacterium]